MKKKADKQFQLVGWLLFLACSGLFIMESLRSISIYSLIGSVVFAIGCLVFVIPLVPGWGTKVES